MGFCKIYMRKRKKEMLMSILGKPFFSTALSITGQLYRLLLAKMSNYYLVHVDM